MYLGLDLGTSGLKGVVIGDDHQIVASAVAELTVQRPGANASEQDPASWVAAIHQVMDQLKHRLDLKAIARIGLSGQMHGSVHLDASGRVLRPCMLWNDGRAVSQCQALMASGDDWLAHSGNLAMPGFTAPKVMWVREHEPAVFDQTAHILLPKDYLRYYLTGELATDPSDASGTLWLNPGTRAWDDLLLARAGVRREQLPQVLEGPDESGRVKAEVAAALGIQPIPVVAGGGDNACGALGLGMSESNQGFVSLGTSGVLFAVSDRHRPCPSQTVHAFAHAIPKTWHQMTVTLSAAQSLSWLASLVNRTVPDLLGALVASGKQRTPVVFLPYLNGERSPHNNPDARGLFFNLSSATDSLDMTLAVLEGVAFSMRDGQAALATAGSQIDQLTAIGGGSRSALWLQIIANVLGVDVHPLAGADQGAAVGAARLAMPDQAQAYPKAVTSAPKYPDAAARGYVDDKYRAYRALYPVCSQLGLVGQQSEHLR
ncbi:xylulokinase [Litorivicinus lipolyticus]|uniref:Xylulose kinase n=1 Tax=Litorivicinus lipolyticus TaxID=418701 RepID=A0A5Q2Q9P4_9GAMM|nr:xylulokinase [Litorivicinus lipolyticus]QGG79903.1 xylulokinase [Litorivicinus lipolyticus]